MKKIDFCEQHRRLLAIAKTFDKICNKHNIPYFMLGGTMLGAIRHKGFIPWDDDMDFGVPRPFYKKLTSILTQELPEPYRCCTYENNPNVFSPFLKIEDTTTVIYDKRIPLPMNEQIGINIDIFPLDYCTKESPKAKKATRMANLYSAIYVDSFDGNIIKNIIKKTFRLLMPYSRIQFLRKMDTLLENENDGCELLANIYGRWRKKEWIPVEWYGIDCKYKFEDTEFCGFKEYNKYLTKMYGNYMELPSEINRIPHAENIFLK